MQCIDPRIDFCIFVARRKMAKYTENGRWKVGAKI